MFKADEDIFLDDISLEELSAILNVKVIKNKNGGENMINTILMNQSL